MSELAREVQVRVDPALKRACPLLTLGCMQGSVKVAPSDGILASNLNRRAQQISAELMPDQIGSQPAIAATRTAYRAIGKDPSRYRNSSEALVRRVISGKGLYFINNVVEINNLLSLETFCPVGCYDRDKIGDEVTFRPGLSGESYKGIGKDPLNLEHLPIFCDANGPFGSPTSDSERAMITPETREILMIIIAFAGSADIDNWSQRAVALCREHASGSNFSYRIIH